MDIFDKIYIDGRSMNDLWREKYADLDPAEREALMKTEFAAALLSGRRVDAALEIGGTEVVEPLWVRTANERLAQRMWIRDAEHVPAMSDEILDGIRASRTAADDRRLALRDARRREELERNRQEEAARQAEQQRSAQTEQERTAQERSAQTEPEQTAQQRSVQTEQRQSEQSGPRADRRQAQFREADPAEMERPYGDGPRRRNVREPGLPGNLGQPRTGPGQESSPAPVRRRTNIREISAQEPGRRALRAAEQMGLRPRPPVTAALTAETIQDRYADAYRPLMGHGPTPEELFDAEQLAAFRELRQMETFPHVASADGLITLAQMDLLRSRDASLLEVASDSGYRSEKELETVAYTEVLLEYAKDPSNPEKCGNLAQNLYECMQGISDLDVQGRLADLVGLSGDPVDQRELWNRVNAPENEPKVNAFFVSLQELTDRARTTFQPFLHMEGMPELTAALEAQPGFAETKERFEAALSNSRVLRHERDWLFSVTEFEAGGDTNVRDVAARVGAEAVRNYFVSGGRLNDMPQRLVSSAGGEFQDQIGEALRKNPQNGTGMEDMMNGRLNLEGAASLLEAGAGDLDTVLFETGRKLDRLSVREGGRAAAAVSDGTAAALENQLRLNEMWSEPEDLEGLTRVGLMALKGQGLTETMSAEHPQARSDVRQEMAGMLFPLGEGQELTEQNLDDLAGLCRRAAENLMTAETPQIDWNDPKAVADQAPYMTAVHQTISAIRQLNDRIGQFDESKMLEGELADSLTALDVIATAAAGVYSNDRPLSHRLIYKNDLDACAPYLSGTTLGDVAQMLPPEKKAKMAGNFWKNVGERIPDRETARSMKEIYAGNAARKAESPRRQDQLTAGENEAPVRGAARNRT